LHGCPGRFSSGFLDGTVAFQRSLPYIVDTLPFHP
jgi:hypothetical protein